MPLKRLQLTGADHGVLSGYVLLRVVSGHQAFAVPIVEPCHGTKTGWEVVQPAVVLVAGPVVVQVCGVVAGGDGGAVGVGGRDAVAH